MSETIADIPLSSTEYTSLNAESGLAVGTAAIALNKGNSWVRLIESATKPSDDSENGTWLTVFPENKSERCITAGSLEIWAKLESKISGSISYQEV